MNDNPYGLQPCQSGSPGCYLYYSPEHRRFLLLQVENTLGHRNEAHPALALNSYSLSALTDEFVARQIVYRKGSQLQLELPDGSIAEPSSNPELAAALHRLVVVGRYTATRPPDLSPGTAGSALEEDFHRLCEAFAGAQTGNDGTRFARILPLSTGAPLAGINVGPIPALCCDLPWPIAGDAPAYGLWKTAKPPLTLTQGYPRLRGLFGDFERILPPASRDVLYTFLLGCFTSAYFDEPVPILAVDGWDRGAGKTETAMAIAHILQGEGASPLSGIRSGDDRPLVAALHADQWILVIDNLEGLVNWMDPSVSSLTTGNRSVQLRALSHNKPFTACARAFILTLTVGNATIHGDFLERTWRAPLEGWPREVWVVPPEHKPNVYARRHCAELRAECYSACKRAADARRPVPSVPSAAGRQTAFYTAAARAFYEVFGRFPDFPSLADVYMLSSAAVKHLPTEAFAARPIPVSGVTPADTARLAGGRALGHRLVLEGGQPQAIKENQE